MTVNVGVFVGVPVLVDVTVAVAEAVISNPLPIGLTGNLFFKSDTYLFIQFVYENLYFRVSLVMSYAG